ncbi:MAG: hypothetical protein JOZ19_14400 [Rubrobacter sp.]|nr:hypothetical protein [Rubrobacter sp.]
MDIYFALAIVLGVLLLLTVVFVTLRLQKRARVRCVVWDWELVLREDGTDEHAMFSFECYLLNDGRLRTSLSGVYVVFVRDGAREVAGHLMDLFSGEELQRALDLPPGQGIRLSLYSTFEGEEGRKASGFRRADLVGRFPNGRIFRRRIAGREDFVVGHKRVGASRKNFAGSPKRRTTRRKDFVADRKKGGASRKNYVRAWWRRPFSPRKLWREQR